MEVKLINNTPLGIADIAICKCYGNEPHSDLEKVKARINRVANVSKHASTIEHLSYSFDIDGVSTRVSFIWNSLVSYFKVFTNIS